MSLSHRHLENAPRPVLDNTQAPRLFVACLCAQWCGTCRDYRACFEAANQSFLQATWLWVDVEEHAHWVEPLDLDNFPTLLVAVNEQPTFFGPITPQPETLTRLLRGKLTPDVPTLQQAHITDLFKRLQQLAQQSKTTGGSPSF